VWVDAIKDLEILEKRVLILGGVFTERGLLLSHAADNFILYISDIHHMGDLVSTKIEVAAHQICEDEGAKITDMGKVVHGRAAAIHSHLFPCWIQRNERFHLVAEGIM